MHNSRHKSLTYKGMKFGRGSVEDILSAFNIDSFVPDDEFAADMDLLVSGKMSPEEHRLYLQSKYRNHN